MKQIITTASAPKAIGPYAQAVAYDGIVDCSGQIGLDPDTMEFAGATVEEQTEQVMRNLAAVLEAAGSRFENVLKCTIFLADMADFATYGRHFPHQPPARETVAVKTLPKGGLVEIGCVAFR